MHPQIEFLLWLFAGACTIFLAYRLSGFVFRLLLFLILFVSASVLILMAMGKNVPGLADMKGFVEEQIEIGSKLKDKLDDFKADEELIGEKLEWIEENARDLQEQVKGNLEKMNEKKTPKKGH